MYVLHGMLNKILNCRISAGKILPHMCKENGTASNYTLLTIIRMRILCQYTGKGLEGHKPTCQRWVG